MDPGLTDLLDALRLNKLDDGIYEAHHAHIDGMRAVFGGQLLAQVIMAAGDALPDKSVKSVQVLFVRGASLDQPVILDVERMHSGRLYGSVTVTVRQADRICVRALVLLDRADIELARHAEATPAVPGPETAARIASGLGGAEIWMIGDADLNDMSATGPAELSVWVRFEGAPDDETVNRALFAFASEPYFFGTALRPHVGLSQALAYREVIPSVITHSLYFHAPFSVSEWFLLSLTSPHLGRGRIYGHGSAYTLGGGLVASVNQENQLRPMPSEPAPPSPTVGGVKQP